MKKPEQLKAKIAELKAELAAAKAAEKAAAAARARKSVQRAVSQSGLLALVEEGMLSAEQLKHELRSLVRVHSDTEPEHRGAVVSDPTGAPPNKEDFV